MAIELLQWSVWPRITELALKAKKRWAAVAYVGAGASKRLPVSGGDILVVDMSLESLRGGRTNPWEIELFMRNGVDVYSLPKLHAKIFVFDDVVLTGSANASAHSETCLVEAALVARSKALADEARDFIRGLCLSPITPGFVSQAQKEFRPPQKERKNGKHPSSKNNEERLWVVSTEPEELSDEEESRLDAQAEQAAQRLCNADGYEVETLTFPRSSRFAAEAKLGDLAILLHSEGPTVDVYPPARVLWTKPYKVGRVARVGVHLERSAESAPYYWGKFKAAALAVNLRLSKGSQREIRRADMRRALLEFFAD